MIHVTFTGESVHQKPDVVVGAGGMPYTDATGIYRTCARHYHPAAYVVGREDRYRRELEGTQP